MMSRAAITKTTAIIIAVVIIIAAVGVGVALYLMGGVPTAPPAKETIKVGFSISLSGKYMTKGKYSLLGIKAWAKWVNEELGGIYVAEYGRNLTVELVYYDDKSDKTTAMRLYEKLVLEDKVDVCLCPYSSHLTYAVTPLLDSYRMFSISHGGASVKIFQRGLKYVIQAISPTTRYLTDCLNCLKTYLDDHPDAFPGWPDTKPKVAIIYAKTEFPMSCAEAAMSWCGDNGWPVVLYQGYPKEFTPEQIASLVETAADHGADVVIGGGYLPDAEAIVTQAKALGVNFKFMAFLVGPAIPEFYEHLGADAEGVVGPTQWEPGMGYTGTDEFPFYGMTEDKFLELCRELDTEVLGYDIEYPSYHAAEACAACLVLQKLIEEAGTLDSDALRAKANEVKMTTFFGKFQIDPGTGLQIAHDMAVIQWQGGEKKIIWPPEVRKAELVFPKPAWP